MKHIIILSSKSSGSTALQNYLKKNFSYKTIPYTIHQEEETLYWTKVGSILQLPQKHMYRSVVPISREMAVDQLNIFFEKNNLIGVTCDLNTTEREFQEYYYRLISSIGNKIIEKSPHHLFNESNLNLMQNFIVNYQDKIDFQILGLIRHPHAVIFSAWNRWKYIPSKFEEEWYCSYKNLLDFQKSLNIKFIEYEKLVNGEIDVEKVIGEVKDANDYEFRKSSVTKWKNKIYGHKLNSNTIFLSEKFNYSDFENKSSLVWFFQLIATKLKIFLSLHFRKLIKIIKA
jgi:hypothetical protein